MCVMDSSAQDIPALGRLHAPRWRLQQMSLTRNSLAAFALAGVAACSDSATTQPTETELSLVRAAFSTSAPGYDSLSSSFNASENTGVFAPRRRGDGRGGPGGEGPGSRDMMGGGFRDEFSGNIGFGPGLGRGPFGDRFSTADCTFDAGTGIISCAPVSRDSLLITRTFRFSTAAGVAQAVRDTATTNKIETTRSVTGVTSFSPRERRGFGHGFGPGGSGGPSGAGDDINTARTTVTSSSSRTISGLATGSTQRTVSGVSSGRESTTGTKASGAFTSLRIMGDTTSGVIIPMVTTGYPYPTAGSVIRSMNVSVTADGGSLVTSSRREVITYDGTNVAKVALTQDGVTKNCTIALPRGRMVCP
jgi:hypothetical protein